MQYDPWQHQSTRFAIAPDHCDEEYEKHSQEFGVKTPWKLMKNMDFMETGYVDGTWIEVTRVSSTGKLWR